MRITRLDLLRYGKFTDKTVSLPKVDQDFHLIVGPNEAGKSTLRSAILDLLFGIETRSRYNFLHMHSEMRLGAALEHGNSALDFIRTKARSKTLQSASGSALPDNVLAPYLGQVDRVFFDQMFGLNHERLVQGGQDILSASNDMGQILFQAAAGVGSLGLIRDKLEAEANSLWARRKSNDREYYVAAAELEQAEAALKAVTVRTRDWQDASSRLSQIGDDLEQARQRYQALEQERMGLERVRRTAPMLNTLKELEQALAGLGPIVSLPEDAAPRLARAEREIAVASQSVQLFEIQQAELSEKIARLQPDESVLARSADIEALFALRQQLRSLDTEIATREGEVQLIWQEVQEAVRQLDWPVVTEEALARRLPGTLVKSTLGKLIRRHEALEQALAASDQTLSQRQEEVRTMGIQIAALPQSGLPAALVDALATARALGDVAAQEKQFETQIARLKRDLETASHQLGSWFHMPEDLSKLQAPTQDEINALTKRRNDLEAKEATVQQRLAELKAEIAALQLEMTQYQATYQPLTLADVQQVRSQRDASWSAIRDGAVALREAAPVYERQVAESDLLADQRHERAQAETEFQLKLDQLARLQQQITELAARQQQQADALAQFDQAWNKQISALGLAQMPLLKVNNWRAARDRVLLAAAALAEAQSAQSALAERAAQAGAALAEIRLALEPATQSPRLSGLLVWADDLVKTLTRSKERRDALLEQKTGAQASIADLSSRKAQAQSAVSAWNEDYQKHLALAHLPVSTQVEAAQEALGVFERIQTQLQKIRDIRVNRIDAMRLALKDFDEQALTLAIAVAPALAQEPAAQVALALNQGLKEAQSLSLELNRLKLETKDVASRLGSAHGQIASSHASLEPLLRQAEAADHDGLRLAIANSDRLRQFNLQWNQTSQQLAGVADGLTREVLEAEFQATEVGTIALQVAALKQQIDDVVHQQNTMSAAYSAAQNALEIIAGQADAARAEAQRQEALARMVNAVERFIKVHTAAKLLRWSIERFRASRQGPMLRRASDVFLALTQGAFSRLAVDFESDPPRLSGQRASGALVEIEGMSDGTRDQLYLALRLAALELHLQKTHAMPFIADDLFINYDDGRARAGLQALADLSVSTQVIFLTHHAHLVPLAHSVLGESLNVVHLG